MLKPDAIARNLEDEIYRRIKERGFEIYKKKRLRLSKRIVNKIYNHNKDKPFHHEYVNYMTYGYSEAFLAILLNGKDAIEELNLVVGYMDPEKAEKWTVRGALGIKNYFKEFPNILQNLIHSSFSKEKVITEALIFFPEEEKLIISLLGEL